MRVLYNGIPLIPPRTGVGRYQERLCRALLEIDPSIELAFWYSLSVGRSLPGDDAGTPARMRPGSRTRLLLQRAVFQPGVARLYPTVMDVLFRLRAGRGGYDVYHETNYVPRPFRGPTVVTVYDLSLALLPETHPRARVYLFERDFARRLDRVDRFLAISRTVAAELVERYALPAERVTVTYPGVDDTTFTADANAPRDAADGSPVLFVGSLEPRKDLPTLFRAYAGLPRELQRAHPLVLVGPPGWKFEAAAGLIRRLGIGERVRWIGFVDDRSLAGLYREAAVLAFPSRYEGFGLPVVEAMASGTPVVCSDIPVLEEVAGGAALRVPVGRHEAWTEALEAALTDAALRDRLRRAGLTRATQFRWRRCAAETLRVYEELAPGAAGVR